MFVGAVATKIRTAGGRLSTRAPRAPEHLHEPRRLHATPYPQAATGPSVSSTSTPVGRRWATAFHRAPSRRRSDPDGNERRRP